MRAFAFLSPVILLAGFATSAHASTVEIDIHNLQFSPAKTDAKVGDTVRWTNRDIIPHTATADGVFDVIIPAKSSASVTLKTAGSYDYRCRFHSNMKAHIDVSKP